MASPTISYQRPSKSQPAYTDLTNIQSADFWGAPVIQASDGSLVCPGFEGNTYASNIWDYVIFGESSVTPGIANVSVNKRRLLDRQKPSGENYSRLVYTGLENAVIDIQLTIWTPMQWIALKKLWINLFPYLKSANLPEEQPTSDTITRVSPDWPPAFQVYHPALVPHLVSAIAILGADGPMPGYIPNSRLFVIHGIEYVPIVHPSQQVADKPQPSAVNPITKVRASTLEVPSYKPPSANANRGPA